MKQIVLVDSELSLNDDDIIRRIVNDDNRASGLSYTQRTREKNKGNVSSLLFDTSKKNSNPCSFILSSSISNCQSSLTIHQCSSTMTKPHGTMANTPMLNNMTEKPSTCFSYLIEPTTPCVLGTANYDEHPANDDEFFLTAGGIIHSCPNIHELSMENAYDHRKRTSCDQLMLFMGKQTTSIENYLNSYDTELDRYAIRARFQPISSSVSTESMNSEIELYNERHAHGLSRKDHTTMSMYSSFLPTTWKSDNYLLLMSVLHHHSSLSTSMDSNKRSRSYEILIE